MPDFKWDEGTFLFNEDKKLNTENKEILVWRVPTVLEHGGGRNLKTCLTRWVTQQQNHTFMHVVTFSL